MDTSFIKKHGLLFIENSRVILFVSLVLSLSFIFVFKVGFWLIAIASCLGVLFALLCVRYWVSGEPAYWFLSVFCCGVIPAIYIKSFSLAITIFCIEMVIASGYFCVNKSKLSCLLSRKIT